MTTYRNDSLMRGARLLDVLAAASGPLTLTSVAEAASLARPTAFRLLAVLCEAGLVRKDDGPTYALGYKIFAMGRWSRARDAIARDAAPVLERLAHATGRTTVLVGLAGPQAVCLVRIVPPGGMEPYASVGMRGEAHASASGKVLLAQQPEDEVRAMYRDHPLNRITARTITSLPTLLADLRRVRVRGYAEEDGEIATFQQAVAVPVPLAEDRAGFALSMALPRAPGAREALAAGTPRMHEAAAEIAAIRSGAGRQPPIS